MILARILSLIQAYTLWLYVGGLLAALLSLREIRAAQKSQGETIFSLEKELADARARRGRSALAAVLVFLAALTVVNFVVIPAQPTPPMPEPTPTTMIIELPTPTPITPTPTRTRIPTRPPPTAAPVVATPTATPPPAPPPSCPDPGVRILSPAVNQAVAGQVTIRGTAQIDQLQFYKLEYGLGDVPQQWHSIGDINRSAVVDGVLGVWNLAGFPNGVAFLRLTVVDISGNFPPPCEVRVVIQQ
jgi:hypothetical protein